MGTPGGFHGYIPSEQGYPFLREAIARYYAKHGVALSTDEIFISDGAKSDLGNLLDLFAQDNTVLIPDPVYPAYVDVNVMAGRKIVYCDANAENGFLPLPDEDVQADLIYICSPNNPTGAVYDHAGLKKWVDYALRQDAIILFDAAYEAFITDSFAAALDLRNRRRQAVRDRDLLAVQDGGVHRHALRLHHCARDAGTRRHELKPHVVAPPDHQIQRHGLHRAARGGSGLYRRRLRPVHGNLDYYRRNARVAADTLDRLGIFYTGGVNSPYIWLRCPGSMKSWDFFDLLLSAHRWSAHQARRLRCQR